MKENYYYLFKMNTLFLNVFALVLMILCCGLFYLIYGNNSFEVFNNNVDLACIVFLPYLLLHELLHSIAYVIHGGKFKNITYGIHLEKGILCCLCKQNIDKKNIMFSLMYPFVFIGVVTLIIGILVDWPLLVILSLTNISGCSGDLVMFYHLSKLKDYSYSEYDDPVSFGLYTKNDFSKLKMLGLNYIGKKRTIERNDLRKFVISKASIIFLITYYIIMILFMVA